MLAPHIILEGWFKSTLPQFFKVLFVLLERIIHRKGEDRYFPSTGSERVWSVAGNQELPPDHPGDYQEPEPSSIAFPGHYQGTGSEMEHPGPYAYGCICIWGCRCHRRGLTHYATVLSPDPVLIQLMC